MINSGFFKIYNLFDNDIQHYRLLNLFDYLNKMNNLFLSLVYEFLIFFALAIQIFQ